MHQFIRQFTPLLPGNQMRSLSVFFGLSLLYPCILLGHMYPIAAPKVYWSVTFRERVRNQYCQLMRVWDRSSNCKKKCKIICLPTVHSGVLSCSQLVETCLCIPDQIGFLKVLVFKERWKLENPEKNLSEKERERTSNKLNPHGVDARIRTQATLVGGEWSPLPPK